MAYITAEHTREIKKQLKSAFPAYKLSVRNEHHISVSVHIEASDLEFNDKTVEALKAYGNVQINSYHPDRIAGSDKTKETIQKILEIVNKGNHDNSDSMSDYFDVGWYVHLELGHWNKPYQAIAA